MNENGRFKALDKAIAHREFYDRCHMHLQDSLRNRLRSAKNDEQKWGTTHDLEKIFFYHDLDSCHAYIRQMKTLCEGDPHRLATSNVCYANCLFRMDSISRSLKIFESIDRKHIPDGETLSEYYNAGYHIYSRLAEGNSQFQATCHRLLDDWWQADSSGFATLFYRNRFRRAVGLEHDTDIIRRLSSCPAKNLNDSSKINFYMAREYIHAGDIDKAIDCYAKSGEYDMRISVKAYSALYELAMLLFQEGNLHKAEHYMRLSLEDTQRSHYRLRYDSVTKSTLTTMRLLIRQERVKQRAYIWTVVVTVFLLIIAIASTIILRTYSTQLELTRDSLVEVSKIKDHFLATYMEKSVTFLKKVDEYRSFLRKTAKHEGLEAVRAQLKKPSFADGEFKDLLAHFDRTFLDIYPDFAEMVNVHIRKEHHLIQPSPDTMSTELRILALIKMGINERYKIAHILNMSPKTVYPYLSKLKSHLKHPERSLDEVMKEL